MPLWVDVFIVVASVAIVVQMGILLGMYLQVRTIVPLVTKTIADVTAKSDDLKAKLDPILVRSSRILENSEARINSVIEDVADMSARVRVQAVRADNLLGDVSDRLQLQVMRVDELASGVISMVEDAGARMSGPVKASVNEASAVMSGIRAGLDSLRGRRRTRGANPDEELFI